MAERGSPLRVVIAPAADEDMREALIWSEERFGERVTSVYRDLLMQAIRDVAADPNRLGSTARPELARGVRTYHLVFSRHRTSRAKGFIKNPRHFLIYRERRGQILEILRVLHDARDVNRHVSDQG